MRYIMKKNFITLLIILLFCILFSSCNFPLFTTSTSSTTQMIKKTTASTTTTTQRTEPEVVTMLLSELLVKENVEFISAIEKKHFLDETFASLPDENTQAFLEYLNTDVEITNDPNKVSKHPVSRECFEGRGMIIYIKYKTKSNMDTIYIDMDGNFLYCEYTTSYGKTKSREFVFSNPNHLLNYQEIKTILGIR